MKRKNKIENSNKFFFLNNKRENTMNIQEIKNNFKKEILKSIDKLLEKKNLQDLNSAIKDGAIQRSTTEWYAFKITTSAKEYVIKYKDVNFLYHLLSNYSIIELENFFLENSYNSKLKFK
jgi:hypothetical protein